MIEVNAQTTNEAFHLPTVTYDIIDLSSVDLANNLGYISPGNKRSTIKNESFANTTLFLATLIGKVVFCQTKGTDEVNLSHLQGLHALINGQKISWGELIIRDMVDRASEQVYSRVICAVIFEKFKDAFGGRPIVQFPKVNIMSKIIESGNVAARLTGKLAVKAKSTENVQTVDE